jgi:DNA replication protein DnaD
VQINVVNLKVLSDRRLLRQLAVFITIKSKYKNGCIYKYTQESLAAKTGISRSAIRSYVKFFLDNGWCELHENKKTKSINLCFKGLGKLDKEPKRILADIKKGTTKELIQQFQLLILKHKQAQFNRVKELSADLNTPTNFKVLQNAKKMAKKYNYNVAKLPPRNARLKMSIKSIAKWLNCSAGKAVEVLNSLRVKGLITIIKCRNLIGKSHIKAQIDRWLADNKNSFCVRGYVIQVSCNEYIF